MSDDRMFTVEALSILSHIHRIFTAASTREAAHAKLADFHNNRFHASMKAYRKTMNRANRYKVGSAQRDAYEAHANIHLNNAENHYNMQEHHTTKSFNASVAGYEHNKIMQRKANDLAFKQAQTINKQKQQLGSEPNPSKRTKYVSPIKPPASSSTPKVQTPKPVKNLDQFTEAVKPANTNTKPKLTKPPKITPKPKTIKTKPPATPKPPKVKARINM